MLQSVFVLWFIAEHVSGIPEDRGLCFSVFLCVTVCCSVLQCVAVCCRMTQCVSMYCSVLQYVTVCLCWIFKLSATANFMKIEGGVAVCCSVLQCVAVRCSVLQYIWVGFYS